MGCVKESDDILIVNHIVKSVEIVHQYNEATLSYEKRYKYEFQDEKIFMSPKRTNLYSVGDTVKYLYIKK